MGKDKGKKKAGILKLVVPQGMDSFKTKKGASSVFDKEDYGFDDPAEISEWDKIYKGQPSTLDNIDPDVEYRQVDRMKKEKQKNSKPQSVFDDKSDDDFYVSEPLDEFISFPPGESSSTPFIHAVARPIEDDFATEDEIKDRALRIAEDFAERFHLVLVGGVPCEYNGKFFVFLREDDAQRKIFINYRKEVGQGSTVSVLRNAANLLRYCIKKVYDEFPVNPNIIVFANGTLEVTTGRFRLNSPKDLANSALSIYYSPSRRDMPNTKNFLETIADGDGELYELMLQAIGYILSNDVKAKSFFYLEGVGDAGKSRFCDLVSSFFPTVGANKVARIALQDLGGKFALGNLVNAKLNISEDLPDNPLSPTTVSRIKMISDSNRLEAEAKYVQAFSFRPTCKLLFASNHPLRLKEYDAAFVNRVVYIPFLHPIPKHKQDKNILEKMQMELPALFNHAFEAYQRLVANGYIWAGSDRFKPEIAVVGTGISLNKEQTLKHFVESCCVYEENHAISVFELQEEYYRFCRERNYIPVMGDRFSRELLTVLPETVTRTKIGNQRRGFKGLKLKKEYESDVI